MDKYNNRELSWMLFNERVLQEAQDKSVPLLQRLRFLGIFSNNQDEFFKVRVANLIRSVRLKNKKPILVCGHTPSELLGNIYEHIKVSQTAFEETYTGVLSELEQHGVYVVNEKQIDDIQMEFCRNYFSSVISVRLVPLMLRKSIDIPFLPDDKIYLGVKMSKKKTKSSRYAIIEMPTSEICPRFVVLPSKEGRTDIMFMDDIIRLFLNDIFFMFSYDEITAHTFKIVRDAELTLDDDVSKSLVEKMSSGISKRHHGRAIRLIYDKEMPLDIRDIIVSKLKLKAGDQLEAGGRYHLLKDLMKFPKVNLALENANPAPLLHPSIKPFESIIDVIKREDIFLNYPYHTFTHVIDLLREAAVDPHVESISITLYRTAEQSKVINALKIAAKNGKLVTVLVELKARFDEEQNIMNSDLLQSEGVRVIHSVEELKVHSKLLLIERREGTKGLKGYVYVGTGNFNENTALLYSDFGLFTAHQGVVEDARKVFDFLKTPHKHYRFKHLLVSPYYMRSQFVRMIETEIRNAKKGKRAYIYGKFNSLTDQKMVRLLYKASAAGVKIRLIIRGACCLCPQEKGLSENIQILSIVDKYLEHARMLICCNGGEPQSYIMSADWMERNLDRRVEVGIPIMDKKIHEIVEDIFDIQWNDNVKSRNLAKENDNGYVRSKGALKLVHRSQIELYNYFKNM